MTWIDTVHNELRKCTDCGLCMNSCPTYTGSRAEGDSPRGRMHLLSLALTADELDQTAARHLDGCIECGACHAPCPTGVQVALARQTHRHASARLDHASFERRVDDLAKTIERDAGARLTVDAVRDLLTTQPTIDSPTPKRHGVLALAGPLLRRAAPTIARRIQGAARQAAQLIHDPALAAALERAGGLLRDVGLAEEHEQAVADVADLMAARDYEHVTVAVFDWLYLRLGDMPLPANLRVVPAYEVFQPSTSEPFDESDVWDHPATVCNGLPGMVEQCGTLPAEHHPASAPTLLSAPAVRILDDLVTAKRTWLAGQHLVTMDSRSLVRFPAARHLAEILDQPPATWGRT